MTRYSKNWDLIRFHIEWIVDVELGYLKANVNDPLSMGCVSHAYC